MDVTPQQPCPCQSGMSYEICCGPWHGGQPAPTAEALMRSRYCAYALGRTDYLINTTHRDNPQYQKNIAAWRRMLEDYCAETGFEGLTVLEHVPSGDRATVSFEARLCQGGKRMVLKEKSRFVKIGKRWLYHSGDTELSS